MGCGWNVPKDQNRLALGLKPPRFLLDQTGQPVLQRIQGTESGGAIHPESIGLNHAHIPATGTLLNRRVPQQKIQHEGGQPRAQHKRPIGTQESQLLQHRSISGRMAEAMAAAAGVDQHVNASSIGNCS